MPKKGSPPHTRGILNPAIIPTTPRGITPAYAGNTLVIAKNDRVAGDHPRIRGEYIEFLFDFSNFLGSPPHTRGILIITWYVFTFPRITPAYAGNTIIININILIY